MAPAHSNHDAAIREQAYLLWEQEGRPHGREMEFWTRAEVALADKPQLDHLTKPTPKTKKPVAKAAEQAAGQIKAAAGVVTSKLKKTAKSGKPDGRSKPKKA